MLIRGLNVVVFNEVTGAVMTSRWFDTYESRADSGLLMEFLNALKHGRIVCFAIKVINYHKLFIFCDTSIGQQELVFWSIRRTKRNTGSYHIIMTSSGYVKLLSNRKYLFLNSSNETTKWGH